MQTKSRQNNFVNKLRFEATLSVDILTFLPQSTVEIYMSWRHPAANGCTLRDGWLKIQRRVSSYRGGIRSRVRILQKLSISETLPTQVGPLHSFTLLNRSKTMVNPST